MNSLKPFRFFASNLESQRGGGADLLISYIDEKTGMSFAVNQWGFASGGAAWNSGASSQVALVSRII